MIGDYYKQTVSVERYTESVSTVGTPTQAWTVASTILALFVPGGGNQRISSGRDTLFASHRVYCAAGTDVTQKDRIAYSGQKYRIMFIKDPNTLSHHKELFLEQVL